jgi:hypothetical protein
MVRALNASTRLHASPSHGVAMGATVQRQEKRFSRGAERSIPDGREITSPTE